MNRLYRSIAMLCLANFLLGCGGGGSSELTEQQKDPGAATAEAKKHIEAGGMMPGPIKQPK